MYQSVKLLFYADDFQLFAPVASLQDCVHVQADLNLLTDWCELNGLKLNVRKCKVITFFRARQPIEFAYMLNNTILQRVESIRDLGVIMDTKMTFVEHIDVIVGRAFANLGFVRRFASEFKDEYTLRTLYTSLVRPKLGHASCVWDPT
jgi:hypothetical protein